MLAVSVAYSPRAGEVDEMLLAVPPGSTVADALERSLIIQRHPNLDLATQRVGIWGKLCSLETALRERDRVEIYRPLQVDPKEARRLRYRKHRGRVGP